MKKIDEVLQSKTGGLYYGNRVLLPFKCHLLKAVIKNDIITDFNPGNTKGAQYYIRHYGTEIYFLDYKQLLGTIEKYDTIKLVVVEESVDIFDFSKHRKIALDVLDHHKLTIEEIDDDEILFIE